MSQRGRRPTPSGPFPTVAGRIQAALDGPRSAAVERVRDFCLHLYHLAPVGYLTHRIDGGILEANYTAGSMLGGSAEQLRGARLMSFAAREEEARLATHLARVAASGDRATLELRLQRPCGTRFHASIESVLIEGEPPSVLSTLTDVTERKRLEATLLERDATLRTMLATVPDGVVGVDEHGSIRSFGAGAERMFGYRSRDVIGRHVGLLFDVVAPPAGFPVKTPARGGYVQRARGRRHDGALFDVEVSTGRFAGASYAVLVVRDVSSQREVEHALDEARAMDAARRLLSGVVHDTSNLLHWVVAAAESLSEVADDPSAVRRRAGELHRMALGGAALVRTMSGALRAGGARSVPTDVDAALTSVGSFLSALLGEETELRLALGADGARVGCDRGQLEQLVVNLLLNARDAMPAGGLVDIATSRVERAGGSSVRLLVCDSGVGMDESVRVRAFSPGFTTKQHGTGLGLDTVRTIVEQARGHIELTSELGAGTCFTIELPEVLAELPRVAPLPRARPSNLLLVERDTLLRSTLRAWLERAGHRVVETSSGQEALEQCAAHRGAFDAMLTEVSPGGLGGVELAERARELCPALSVLFMSGQPRDDLVRGGMLAPDVFLVGKPCSKHELAEALQQSVGAAAPSSLLLVEDDSLNRRMVGTLLEQRGYQVRLAATLAEAIEHHRAGPADVVLADARLPDGNVRTLVERLRDDVDVPVLVFSGLEPDVDPELAWVLDLPRTKFMQKPAGIDDLVRGIETLREAE